MRVNIPGCILGMCVHMQVSVSSASLWSKLLNCWDDLFPSNLKGYCVMPTFRTKCQISDVKIIISEVKLSKYGRFAIIRRQSHPRARAPGSRQIEPQVNNHPSAEPGCIYIERGPVHFLWSIFYSYRYPDRPI